MKKVDYRVTLGAIVAVALGFFGCEAPQPDAQKHSHQHQPSFSKAIAVLHPTNGSEAHGVVTFTASEGGVHVSATVSGLTPGKHGFHIHQYGDCSSSDGKSAGGHFNPENKQHGAPDAEIRHIGDLGNITADDSANGSLDYVDSHLTFDGANSIIGRGVIVHAGNDDLTSQPTGAAGARVACGTIGVAK